MSSTALRSSGRILFIYPVFAMQFIIRRMRHRGRAMGGRQDLNADLLQGEVRIGLANNTPMGRPSMTASFQCAGKFVPEIPHLYDVQVHSLLGNILVITGTEIVDGVAYAQSWQCKIV